MVPLQGKSGKVNLEEEKQQGVLGEGCGDLGSSENFRLRTEIGKGSEQILRRAETECVESI